MRKLILKYILISIYYIVEMHSNIKKFSDCLPQKILDGLQYIQLHFLNLQNIWKIFIIILHIEQMSITVSNCNDICKSPTNTSKAKMLYSFPKADRFCSSHTSLCPKFYQTDYKWPKRATTFGYGNKYDFTSEAPVSPPPNQYNCDSNFKKGSKKGFGFGCGRVEMQITGPLVDTIKNKNPGPGSYHIPSSLERVSYSIRKKCTKQDLWKKSIPGPGSYESINTLNQKGKYFLAKYKNSCAPSISLLQRKDLTNGFKPGPGSYSTLEGTSPQGKYLSSKHGNSLSRHFGRQKRGSLIQKLKTPGPGFYKLPSQFGYYQSAKIKTDDKQNLPAKA